MTTLTLPVSRREPLLTSVVKPGVSLFTRIKSAFRRVVPYTFSIAGLGFLAAAAFTISLTIGLVAVGVSFLILEWRVVGE